MVAWQDNVPGGYYTPGEHIGHISKTYTAIIAPIFDQCVNKIIAPQE